MTRKEAVELAASLKHRDGELYAEVRGERLHLVGSPIRPFGGDGSHSLDWSVSDQERVMAHWRTYCEVVDDHYARAATTA